MPYELMPLFIECKKTQSNRKMTYLIKHQTDSNDDRGVCKT